MDWYDVDCEVFDLEQELQCAVSSLEAIKADCEHLEPSEGLLGDLAGDADRALYTIADVCKRLDALKEAARKNSNRSWEEEVHDMCDNDGASELIGEIANYCDVLARQQRRDPQGVIMAESHLATRELLLAAQEQFEQGQVFSRD